MTEKETEVLERALESVAEYRDAKLATDQVAKVIIRRGIGEMPQILSLCTPAQVAGLLKRAVNAATRSYAWQERRIQEGEADALKRGESPDMQEVSCETFEREHPFENLGATAQAVEDIALRYTEVYAAAMAAAYPGLECAGLPLHTYKTPRGEWKECFSIAESCAAISRAREQRQEEKTEEAKAALARILAMT